MKLSNSLTDLADQVRVARDAILGAERTFGEKALEAGRLLVQAKAQCRHGDWLTFLERAGVKERSARQWMQLATSGLKSATVADLGGVRGALEFLVTWRLPTFEEALFISDSTLNGASGEEVAAHGVGYVWEDGEQRGYYHVGILAGEGCICTRRPMLPRIEVEGQPPVDTIVAALTADLPLPISDWRLQFVDRATPSIVLPPFWTETTFRERALA